MSGPQLDLFGDDSAPPRARGEAVRPRIEGLQSPSGIVPPPPMRPELMIGTCAWNHEHWRGTFYPDRLPAGSDLAFYSRFHNSVEVDSSFYRVPAPSTVAKWLDQTPESFRFAVKAPRSLTHEGGLSLDNRVARADWDSLLEILPLFGGRLAALLVQLGPRIQAAREKDLLAVLRSLPPGTPVAVEFRHKSWDREETTAMLRETNAVRAWTDAYLDAGRAVAANDPFHFAESGSFRYVRLLGNVSTKYDPAGGLRHRYGEILFERNSDLSDWARRIAETLRGHMNCLAYINNHYQGFSPLTAALLREQVEALMAPPTSGAGGAGRGTPP